MQRFEYLIGYQMKKAHNVFNSEYIIGGIGSTFRRSILEEVGLYDTNTMTEDIDLTMKILAQGRQQEQATPRSPMTPLATPTRCFRSRPWCGQRYRWKYGWMQTFLKHYRMFFSRDKKHTVGLSWFFRPYAIWQEVVYLIEPMVVTIIIGVAIYFHSPMTLVSAIAIISSYLIVTDILGIGYIFHARTSWC